MTKPNDEQQLLACPFCGSKSHIKEGSIQGVFGYKIYCRNLRCYIRPEVFDQSKNDALKMWNHRPPSPRAGLSNFQIQRAMMLECSDITVKLKSEELNRLSTAVYNAQPSDRTVGELSDEYIGKLLNKLRSCNLGFKGDQWERRQHSIQVFRDILAEALSKHTTGKESSG